MFKRLLKESSLVLAVIAVITLLFLNQSQDLNKIIILNVLALGTVLYSAFNVVRHADTLAHRFGEPFGSLILTFSIVALEVALISIIILTGSSSAPFIMRDTIYAVAIIVLAGIVGIAMLMGGYKHKNLHFNFTGINHYLMTIIPLTVIVLVIPSLLGGTYTKPQLVVVALTCLVLYIVFLIVQTKTHRRFFVYETEKSEGQKECVAAKPKPEDSNAWHFVFLLLHLIAVIGVAKLNSYPMENLFAKLNAPPALKGAVIAMMILTPEGLSAVLSALKNQTQRAMNLLLGTVASTISLTVPIVTIIAIAINQPLVLGLEPVHVVLLISTIMVCQVSLTGGKVNAHSGSAHLAMFVIYLMLLFQ